MGVSKLEVGFGVPELLGTRAVGWGPLLYSMKSSLYRIRRNRLPPLPKSRDEVHFEGEWSITHAGERFLRTEDGEGNDKIITFSTADKLKHLSESEKIYVDGTFQTCPKLFYQIFTLHSMKYGKQFPFAYCLLPGISRGIYLRALELVKQKSRNLGYLMNPAEILTDFELAIIQAIELTFPSSQVNGCFFSFHSSSESKNIKTWSSDCISGECFFLFFHTSDSSTCLCTCNEMYA